MKLFFFENMKREKVDLNLNWHENNNSSSYYDSENLPDNPLGMESLKIRDEQMSSGGHENHSGIQCWPHLARLNTDMCWIASSKVRLKGLLIRCTQK